MEKSFFNLPVKDEEEANEKVMCVNRNNDNTTGNLLDFTYLKKNRLIAIDLDKQTNLKDPQQIGFIVRCLVTRRAAMCSIIKKSEKTTFGFLQNYANII